MYTVTMENGCSCFAKSEFEKVVTFKTQHEAYNYTNTLMETMNEDFCQTHMFYAEQSNDNQFKIRVSANTGQGDSCGIDGEDSSSGCGTSCGF